MSCKPIEVTPRRGFLQRIVSATAAVPLSGVIAGGVATTSSPVLAAPPPATPVNTVLGYVCLSQDEAAFVETLVNVMCPADDFTPSGVDCGLAVYIDRQLGGDFGRGAKRYVHGPWLQGKPQHGYQLPMTPEQYFKAGVAAVNAACSQRFGKPFDQISAGDADAFLGELAAGKVSDPELHLSSWFNELVYPLFAQACFADPIYGGNVGKVFWKLIGYPGLPATHTVDMIQFRGKPFPGAHDPKSIADFS